MSQSEQLPGKPIRRRLRLPGFDYAEPGRVYFVTIRAAAGTEPFLDQDIARAVVKALDYQREAGRISVYAFVLMPDHLHLVLSVAEGKGALTDIIRDFKAFTTTTARRLGLGAQLWQRSFHDHVVRRAESLTAICEYILANPVRKGLARCPEEWTFGGMPDPWPY